MNAFNLGDRVNIPIMKATGVIVYIGKTHFSKGEWFGVVLDEPKGRCDGGLDGIRYFKCPKDHGIFLRDSVIQSECVHNNGDRDEQHKVASNCFEHSYNLKTNFKVADETSTNATKCTNTSKMQSKNVEHKVQGKCTANNNENKFILEKARENTIKNTTSEVDTSSSDSRIKYPNYLKASSKISWNHIREAKNFTSAKTKCNSNRNGICSSNSSKANCSNCSKLDFVKSEIENLKDKLKKVEEFQHETLLKFDIMQKEIILLKKEIDYQKKKVNCEKQMSKLLEMGLYDFYKINSSFVDVHHNESNFLVEKFDLKNIETLISRQKAALDEQEKRTLRGLFEIREFLNKNSESRDSKLNTLIHSSKYPLKVRGINTCTSLKPLGTEKKVCIPEEVASKSKENIEIIETSQFHISEKRGRKRSYNKD